MSPQQLRHDLLWEETDDLWNRRAITGLSLIGMAAMTPVVLRQMGIIRHLPDPPIEGFNSDKVNLSDTAFQHGPPDGTMSMASLAMNLVLAGLGGKDRAQQRPWLPLVAAGKAAMDAGMAGMLFYKMGFRLKAWCGYCITGALANTAMFALTVPEAKRAVTSALSDGSERLERPSAHVLTAGSRLVGSR